MEVTLTPSKYKVWDLIDKKFLAPDACIDTRKWLFLEELCSFVAYELGAKAFRCKFLQSTELLEK